jgi:GxxExxY protein
MSNQRITGPASRDFAHQNQSPLHKNEISGRIIGAAIEVHRFHGPGLVEQVHGESLCHEFALRSIPFERQKPVPFYYKDVGLGSDLRLDPIVHGKVTIDNKAKKEVLPIDKTKLLTYFRLAKLRFGLIINFHERVLKDGIIRIVKALLPPEPSSKGSFSI